MIIHLKSNTPTDTIAQLAEKSQSIRLTQNGVDILVTPSAL